MQMLSFLLSAIYLIVSGGGSSETEAIQLYDFDPQTAQTTYVSGMSGVDNPSFVCLNKRGDRLYAVSEQSAMTSSAVAFAFDKDKKCFTRLNSSQAKGGGPCNITLFPDEKHLVTSNYGGGSITLFEVNKDGTLGEGSFLPFQGKSVIPDRQDKPYLHAAYFTPDKRFLMANDLGTDKIHVLPVSKGKNGTSPLDETGAYDVDIKPGAGPRHLCWAPNGKYAYLIGELSGEVFTLRYAHKRLSVIQCIQADSLNAGGSADIHISPDGKFVYASHRLKGDGLSIMKVRSDGTLEKIGYQATGTHPRNFTISPDGRYVLVACRDDNMVEIYRRDAETGMLSDTGKRIKSYRPLCLKWL